MHDLSDRHREFGSTNEPQEPPFEHTVASGCDHQFVKTSDAAARRPFDLLNSLDDVIERRQTQPDRRVDRGLEQGVRNARPREVDDRALR